MRSLSLPKSGFLFSVALTIIIAACGDDTTGPVSPQDLPFPTEIEHDGLLFGLSSVTAGDRVVNSLWVQNVTDATVERVFPGGCMVTNIIAFREGEFGDPVWELSDVPGAGGCETNTQGVLLPARSIDFPRGWRSFVPPSMVLGDSLDAGLYRFGALNVEVDGELGEGIAPSMIANQPVRLQPTP